VDRAIDAAELARVIERLPHGLDTPLGEAGGLVSGGEGQRVRLGRALLRPGIRLAILDEPFRGLDLEQRRKLLAHSRTAWRDATLLAISHDIAESLTFDRVLVLEDGCVVEDGNPRQLAGNPESRFQAMLEAERAVRDELWNGPHWRHLNLQNGQLSS
jgi:ATP-binding cassette subfamily B protein